MAMTHPPQHAYPGMPFNLRPEGASLADATTFPLVKEESFEAIRMVIHQGQEISDHQVEGAITGVMALLAARGERVAVEGMMSVRGEGSAFVRPAEAGGLGRKVENEESGGGEEIVWGRRRGRE